MINWYGVFDSMEEVCFLDVNKNQLIFNFDERVRECDVELYLLAQSLHISFTKDGWYPFISLKLICESNEVALLTLPQKIMAEEIRSVHVCHVGVQPVEKFFDVKRMS